jgi:hypothetical protein
MSACLVATKVKFNWHDAEYTHLTALYRCTPLPPLQVGDIPLSSAQYNDFNEAYDGPDGTSGGAMHLPLAVSSLSLYYNQQAGTRGTLL